MCVWCIVFSTVTSVTYNFEVDIFSAQFFYSPPSTLYVFIMSCIIAPLWEELVFRHAAIRHFKNNSNPVYLIIIISAIFGWLHNKPGYSDGIYIQGVLGFIFGCVYVKNGYHYWSSVTLHFMWNYTLFMAPYVM